MFFRGGNLDIRMARSDLVGESLWLAGEKWPGDVADPEAQVSLLGDSSMEVPVACTCIDSRIGSSATLWHPESSTHALARSLSLAPYSDDPWNHCCPTDVIHCPTHNTPLVVEPPLRKYKDFSFKRVGEAVDFFRQVLEGLEFLHRHCIAHRDYTWRHIAMDAQCPWPEYYITLSPASCIYGPDEEFLVALPRACGDPSVPEFNQGRLTLHNPFSTDVYCLGNLIRRDFLEVYSNLDFMNDLVCAMVQTEPSRRPPMDEVVDAFEQAVGVLSMQMLRKPLRKRRSQLARFFCACF